MISGFRSRTGCYTCRIRKKKCDEQYPSCSNCQRRDLQCYGFGASPPDWMQGKRSWAEITATAEAIQLRRQAETQYKASRRSKQHASETRASDFPEESWKSESTIIIRDQQIPILDSIWWDCGLCSILPTHKPPREDARLVILYLDFIFPIQFAFYPMSSQTDHSWLISSLCRNEARYHAAMSISACHNASLCDPDRIDKAGLTLEVNERQAIAARSLQTVITRLNLRKHTPRDVIKMGLQILEVMHQLLSLEIFSMLEGTWELHHHATLNLLNMLHTYSLEPVPENAEAAASLSPLEMALKDYSSPDDQRNLEFHVTCILWIDIIANAIFGSAPGIPRNFDYLPHLYSNNLRTHEIMGCHSSVMATSAEITEIADWKTIRDQTNSLDPQELLRRAKSVAARMADILRKLEGSPRINMTEIEAGSHLVSLHFAYAAQVYLHVIVIGSSAEHHELVTLVNRSLPLMEALPSHLIIRINWALTITGCMSHKSLYGRFRGLITRLAAQKQPMGMTRKGLMVMEECWRLRESGSVSKTNCDWKTALESLGKRILFI